MRSWPLGGNTPTSEWNDWPKPRITNCQQISFLYLTFQILDYRFRAYFYFIITPKLKVAFFSFVGGWGPYVTMYKIGLYRVSQEECAILRESVPYVKLYRYNPKHLYPKLNGYGDNGHRKVGACVVSTYCSLRDAIHVHCAWAASVAINNLFVCRLQSVHVSSDVTR